MKKRLISIVTCLCLALSLCTAQATESGEWSTVYEQDFQAEGLTTKDVTDAGWKLDTFRIPTVEKDYKSGLQMETGALSSYALYNKALSGKYKVTFQLFIGTPNQYMIYFGGSLNNAGTVDTSKTQLLELKKASGGYRVELNGTSNDTPNIIPSGSGDKNIELLCDGNTITATVKNTDGTTIETVTSEVEGGADGYLQFAPGNGYIERMTIRNIKIEQYSRYITASVATTTQAERPLEVTFSEPVTSTALNDAISITPSVDYDLTLSADKKTASIALDDPAEGTEYTLKIDPFEITGAKFKTALTQKFTVYNTVSDVSDNFENLCTVKRGTAVNAWIKLAPTMTAKSVKLRAGSVTQDAVYSSESGRYEAEIVPTENAVMQFEVTGEDDYTIIYKAKYAVSLAEISAQAGGFANGSGAVGTLAGNESGSVSASFTTDATECMALIALYDADGNMVKLTPTVGSTAELTNLPSSLSGYTVRAMLIKNFATPSMLCGGMELK